MTESPGDVTLQTYEAQASEYAAQTTDADSPLLEIVLERIGGEVPAGGSVLELGSGPGREADTLEAAGLRVRRTDGAQAFVDMMRAAGHHAEVLDYRSDPLDGPYDLVFAEATLLHLTRAELSSLLYRLAGSLRDGGLLAFSVKEGDGDGWTTARLGEPRWYTYWREDGLREVLERCGWEVRLLQTHDAAAGRWIDVLAQPR